MLVVDIRNTKYQRNIEIIGSINNCIYYYEERIKDDILYLTLFEYNIETNRECIVMTYILSDKASVIHPILLENIIYLVLEDGQGGIWIFKIDKERKIEVSRSKIECDGTYVKCQALDNRYLLISTKCVDNYDNNEFDLKYNFYLYDTESQKLFLAKDSIFAGVDPLDIRIFKEDNVYNALILKRNLNLGSKAELEKSVLLVCSSVLVDNIRSRSEELFTRYVFEHGEKGSLEIVGEDTQNIYFIFKSILRSDIGLCSYNKKSECLKKIKNLKPLESKLNKYHISRYPFKIHVLSHNQESSRVEGVFNCSINTEFSPRYGEFMDCIEDRFIICKNVLLAPNNTQEEYITIYDNILKTEECFKARCFVFDQKLFLY